MRQLIMLVALIAASSAHAKRPKVYSAMAVKVIVADCIDEERETRSEAERRETEAGRYIIGCVEDKLKQY